MFSLASLLQDEHKRPSTFLPGVTSGDPASHYNRASSGPVYPLSAYPDHDNYPASINGVYQGGQTDYLPSSVHSDVSHAAGSNSRYVQQTGPTTPLIPQVPFTGIRGSTNCQDGLMARLLTTIPTINEYISESGEFHSESSSSDSGLESSDISSVSGDSTSSSPPQQSSKPVAVVKKSDKKPLRVCYTDKQLHRLDRLFIENPYPEVDLMERLSEELDLPEKKLRIWFQNKRARTRRRLQAYGPTPFMPSTLLSALAAGYQASSKETGVRTSSPIPLQYARLSTTTRSPHSFQLQHSLVPATMGLTPCFQIQSPPVPITTSSPPSVNPHLESRHLSVPVTNRNLLITTGLYSPHCHLGSVPSGLRCQTENTVKREHQISPSQTMKQIQPTSSANRDRHLMSSVSKSSHAIPVLSRDVTHIPFNYMSSPSSQGQNLSNSPVPPAQSHNMLSNSPVFPYQNHSLLNGPVFPSDYVYSSYYPYL